MRLQNSIFLWVFPAAVIPLTVLALVATAWSEQRYLEDAERQLYAGLGSVMAGLERRLLVERDVVTGRSRVPAVDAFVPVLEALEQGRPHHQTLRRFEQVSRFFETFQSVRTSLNTVRILDLEGNTLVKVRNGRRVSAPTGSLGSLPYVEPEPLEPRFSTMLAGLRPREMGSLLLPVENAVDTPGRLAAVFNTAMVLERGDKPVGYLTIDPPADALSRILGVAPRILHGTLLIAEINPSDPDRDGLILYDDETGIDFQGVRYDRPRLVERYPGVYATAMVEPYGTVDHEDGRTRVYFQEFLPYPDRLVSWMIGFRVQASDLRAPFRHIRVGIVASLMAALLLSLALARTGSRRIAKPVTRLADSLAAFAAGRREHRVKPAGPWEIEQAGRAFNRMADSLDAAERERDEARLAQARSSRLASLGQMAAGIAHEISNPINTILSLTTLIERELPVEAAATRADVQSIREESERAAETIRAILNFSREIGGENLPFDAESWVRETVRLAEKECRACGATIVVNIEGQSTLSGDARLLQRALRNLLENAAQASPPGEDVIVNLRRQDEMACIEVLDRGTGLNAEQADRAFDPFYTTKPEGQGSGLGLSISLGIVQFHGGSLELGNRDDGGAVARILLPITDEAIAPGQAE